VAAPRMRKLPVYPGGPGRLQVVEAGGNDTDASDLLPQTHEVNLSCRIVATPLCSQFQLAVTSCAQQANCF
jgi:hypothetical protein